MRGNFMVQIISTQNSTWQGTITWADGRKKVPFRSTLELLRLMDSALDGCAEGEEPADQES